MKSKKVAAVIVLLVTVSLIFFAVHVYNEPAANTTNVVVPNTPSPDSNDNLELVSSEELSDEEIRNIIHETKSRVRKVKDRINHEYYKDHYDGDILMYRYVERGVESESYTGYDLYYDEKGKLIYADIAHYRDALYSIYFYNDELLHVKMGPSSNKSRVFINGGMENVKSVIKKRPGYAFVLEDISYCLENAYE